jgi:hypothetical protein
VNANGGEQVIGFKHLAFDVPKLDPVIATLRAESIEPDPIIDLSDAIPGCRIVFFRDREGKILELMEGYRDQEGVTTELMTRKGFLGRMVRLGKITSDTMSSNPGIGWPGNAEAGAAAVQPWPAHGRPGYG